ncbi:hypothetical protein CsSME_00029688 [Camellia sinensis var. sinensis]
MKERASRRGSGLGFCSSILLKCYRVLDASAHEKLHRILVTNLSKCTLFLVGDLTCFNKDLLCEVCSATFAEYPKSNMKDQLPKCNGKGFSIDIFSLCCRLGCYVRRLRGFYWKKGSSQSAILGEATINLLIMLMY